MYVMPLPEAYTTVIGNIDANEFTGNVYDQLTSDDLDGLALIDQRARRALNIGSWLTSINRTWPLRVTFPTDTIAS